jgi:hypothetical protein
MEKFTLTREQRTVTLAVKRYLTAEITVEEDYYSSLISGFDEWLENHTFYITVSAYNPTGHLYAITEVIGDDTQSEWVAEGGALLYYRLLKLTPFAEFECYAQQTIDLVREKYPERSLSKDYIQAAFDEAYMTPDELAKRIMDEFDRLIEHAISY